MESILFHPDSSKQSTTSSDFFSSNSNLDELEPYFVSPNLPSPPHASSAQPPHLHRPSFVVDLIDTNLERRLVSIDADDTPIPNCEHAIVIEDPNPPAIHAQEEEEEEEDVRGCLLGVKRKTLENMHELYKTHGRELGFSVRKSTSRKKDKEFMYSQVFVCSCEGFRTSKEPKRKCPITRSGYGAAMKAKFNEDEGCFVVVHETDHNHAFTRTEWGGLHRSERRISDEKWQVIEDMIDSGLRATDSYCYMAHEVGGDESIGHTTKDHLNFVNRLKMKEIEGGDAQKIVNILEK